MNLMLPGINVQQLLQKICHVPVIVVIAKTGTDDKANMLLHGACDYIIKPFSNRELLARAQVQL